MCVCVWGGAQHASKPFDIVAPELDRGGWGQREIEKREGARERGQTERERERGAEKRKERSGVERPFHLTMEEAP